MTQSDQLRLDDQLCFALYAATNAVTRAYRPLLRPLGITYPQYLTLMVLWQLGDCSISDIAERLGLPGHAITPIVARLQTAGLVARQRDDDDRRVVLVRLTPAGARLERAASQVQRTVACQTGLSARQLDALRSELHGLVDDMSNHTTDSLRIEGEAS